MNSNCQLESDTNIETSVMYHLSIVLLVPIGRFFSAVVNVYVIVCLRRYVRVVRFLNDFCNDFDAVLTAKKEAPLLDTISVTCIKDWRFFRKTPKHDKKFIKFICIENVCIQTNFHSSCKKHLDFWIG